MEKEKIKCLGSSIVGEDGNVEISQKVMERLHIKPGDNVNLIGREDGNIIIENPKLQEPGVYEGEIKLILEGTNADDKCEYESGHYLDPEYAKKHDLKPGELVQYKLLEDGEIGIIGRLYKDIKIEVFNQ